MTKRRSHASFYDGNRRTQARRPADRLRGACFADAVNSSSATWKPSVSDAYAASRRLMTSSASILSAGSDGRLRWPGGQGRGLRCTWASRSSKLPHLCTARPLASRISASRALLSRLRQLILQGRVTKIEEVRGFSSHTAYTAISPHPTSETTNVRRVTRINLFILPPSLTAQLPALAFPQHPDEHGPQRPILLAVDQQPGTGPALRGSSRTRRSARHARGRAA
jgi:hypothetical protein